MEPLKSLMLVSITRWMYQRIEFYDWIIDWSVENMSPWIKSICYGFDKYFITIFFKNKFGEIVKCRSEETRYEWHLQWIFACHLTCHRYLKEIADNFRSRLIEIWCNIKLNMSAVIKVVTVPKIRVLRNPFILFSERFPSRSRCSKKICW